MLRPRACFHERCRPHPACAEIPTSPQAHRTTMTTRAEVARDAFEHVDIEASRKLHDTAFSDLEIAPEQHLTYVLPYIITHCKRD